jgi:hypothetical protein
MARLSEWPQSAAVKKRTGRRFRRTRPVKTLILSDFITDEPPDRDKGFTFTLYFKDEDEEALTGSLSLTGGVTDESDGELTPPGDIFMDLTTVTLDDGTDAGKMSVTLKHGQLISMDIPFGMVRIVQTTGWPYVTSFTDSHTPQNPEPGRDTGDRIISEEEVRIFAFTNEYNSTPPTGIDMGSGVSLPFILLICGFVLVYKGVSDLRRRRAWER